MNSKWSVSTAGGNSEHCVAQTQEVEKVFRPSRQARGRREYLHCDKQKVGSRLFYANGVGGELNGPQRPVLRKREAVAERPYTDGSTALFGIKSRRVENSEWNWSPSAVLQSQD